MNTENSAISLDGVQAIFTFAFKDPRWKKKFLIGILLGFAGYFIPIIPGILVLGYAATIMRQIIVENSGASLPEWNDWGVLFSRGIKMGGAMLIFLLPAILFFIAGYALMMLPIFGEIFSNGLHNSGNSEIAGAQLLGMFGGMALFVIGMILTFPISIFLPAAIAHGIAGDSFIAIFRIGAWWKILRANIGGFFTAFVLIMGLYMILIFALQVVYMTLILCFLLPFMSAILMFYLTLVCAVAIAEAYRRGAQISGREAAIEKPLHFDPV